MQFKNNFFKHTKKIEKKTFLFDLKFQNKINAI